MCGLLLSHSYVRVNYRFYQKSKIFLFSYIKFTHTISFGEQNKYSEGKDFYFGKYGSFEFNCHYRQSSNTESVRFQPRVKLSQKKLSSNGRGINQFLTWDSTIQLKFFDSTFQNPMDPSTFYLGSQMYFQAIWNQTFTDKFPVDFHLSDCTIRDQSSVTLNKGFTLKIELITNF